MIELTVTELRKILEKLESQGHGDKGCAFGYDSNCAYTSVTDKYKIEGKCVYFCELECYIF